ncbi:hypothetical protein ACFVFJ_48565, partial [Streptomyces sp. NPDC057717]|uniref:scabin-related ADP-ribosyltransferase n=1 Tax=Streptomyces sp. NPDC057717 TaxID=3346224 RepID=UPI0036CCB29C
PPVIPGYNTHTPGHWAAAPPVIPGYNTHTPGHWAAASGYGAPGYVPTMHAGPPPVLVHAPPPNAHPYGLHPAAFMPPAMHHPPGPLQQPMAPQPPAPQPRLVASSKYAGPSPQKLGMNDDDFSDSGEIATDIMHDNSDMEKKEEKQETYETHSSKYRRETTGRPQPSAGFGRSRFGLRPDRIFPTRRGKPSGLLYRKDNEDLYRYDARPYETIFLEGFRPWNNKVPRSLRHHMTHMQKSAFVSTTRAQQKFAANLAALPWIMQPDKTAYRYVIKAPGGIDLLETLKTKAYVTEQEVMFWKGIRPQFIDRVEVVNEKGQVFKVIMRHEWEEKGAQKEARRLLNRAASVEPQITREMNEVVNVLKSGWLRGVNQRVKTENSLKRKLKKLMKENPGASFSKVADSVNDALRYTIQFETKKYARRVTQTAEVLQKMGFELAGYRNTWDKSGYTTIYSWWHDPEDHICFEIQFHTDGSYNAMQVVHELSEKARRPGITAAELAANKEARWNIFGKVSIPPGAVGLRL